MKLIIALWNVGMYYIGQVTGFREELGSIALV
jgi:hypothetical protein